jgi:hypothetical protein
MRYAFAMTFVVALATFGSPPSPAAADDAQVARPLSRDDLRLLGLPYPRRPSRCS